MNNKQAKRLRRLSKATGLTKRAVKRAFSNMNRIERGKIFTNDSSR